MGEGSTGTPLEDLKRFSAIREGKKTLCWLGVHLVTNGLPPDSPAVVKLREALEALRALEGKPVGR
jgi:hypothetical protein